MAITPGQRFVRRHDAARGSTSNTTAADLTYDTAVLLEGGYTYNGPDVEVDTAGLYLTVFDVGQADVASTRAVGTLVPRVGGVDQTRFRATHRYLRNSGGTEGASIGMAILDLSASDDVRVRNPGVLTPTDALGNYATRSGAGGGLQLIRLPAGNLTHVERTVDAAEVGTSNINATRPWIDSSGTWTKVTYDSEVIDDDSLYSGSGGDVTLAASTKYLVVWGMTPYSTDASRHTYVGALNLDGSRVQTGSSYQRNTASQGPPICGMYLVETGGSAETLFLEATHEIEGGDAGTPQISDAYLQVLELPSTAEWIHADNGATDSLTTALAGTGTWYDTPLSSTQRTDGGSNLSLDAANDAVQNDSGGSLGVLAIGWHRWDRDSGASGTRKMPWTRWDNGGTSLNYGVAGAYSRGQQSTDDCWQAHYCSVITTDLADGADLSFQVNEPASAANSDMGIYASASRHFLGVQVLDLSSLEATAAETFEASLSASGSGTATGVCTRKLAATVSAAGAATGTGSLVTTAVSGAVKSIVTNDGNVQTLSTASASYAAGTRVAVFADAGRDDHTDGLGADWSITDSASTNSLTWTQVALGTIDLVEGATYGAQSVMWISSELTATESFTVTVDPDSTSTALFFVGVAAVELTNSDGTLIDVGYYHGNANPATPTGLTNPTTGDYQIYFSAAQVNAGITSWDSAPTDFTDMSGGETTATDVSMNLMDSSTNTDGTVEFGMTVGGGDFFNLHHIHAVFNEAGQEVVSHYVDASSVTDQQTATSDSFTPSAGGKLYVFVDALRVNTSTTFDWSISDTEGLTWTNLYDSGDVDNAGGNNFDGSSQVWVSEAIGTPASMTITVDAFDSGTETAIYAFTVLEDPQGRDVVNSAYLTDGSTSSGDTSIYDVSLDLGAVPSGEQIYHFSSSTNSPSTHSFDAEPAGFTAIATDAVGYFGTETMTSLTNTTQVVGHGFNEGGGQPRHSGAAFIELGTTSTLVEFAASLTASGSGTATGTATSALASSLTASGSGTATGSTTIGFAASLSGAGTGTATGTATRKLAADLSAAGQADSQGTPTSNLAASLSAAGAATATGQHTAQLEAALSGSGSGTATGSAAAQLASTLSAAGTGSSSGTATRKLSASLSAAGTGTATATASATFAASLSAAGTGTGTGLATRALSASLTAAGTGTATGTPTAKLAVALQAEGTGSATGSATGLVQFVASLSGAGTATATGTALRRLAASLSAAGTATATGSVTPNAFFEASLSAAGTATATGSATHNLAASLSASGTGSGTGNATRKLAATLTAAGTGTADGQVVGAPVQLVAALTASGSGTATGTATRKLAAELTAAGAATATGETTVFLTASLTAAGTATATGSVVGKVEATLSAAGSGTGTGLATRKLAASLIASGTGTATGSTSDAPVQLAASLSAAGSATATGTTTRPLSASLTGAGNGSGSGTATRSLSATLTAVGAATGDGRVTSFMLADLDAEGSGTATGVVTIPLAASLSASGSGTATAAVGPVYKLSGTAELRLAASVVSLELASAVTHMGLAARVVAMSVAGETSESRASASASIKT